MNFVTALLAAAAASLSPDDPFKPMREQMVAQQLVARGVTSARVLEAMAAVPRERFMPKGSEKFAYSDSPHPIGHGQTISQPYIVALMTELIAPESDDKVLEVGTGSGYQAAVLAELVDHVYSIEIVDALAESAKSALQAVGYTNVSVRTGDGYRGWPEQAPFDSIIVTAAPDHIPKPLVDQLKEGGKMVIPVGEGVQELVLLQKKDGTMDRQSVIPVRFVPMTGEAMETDSID